jgi:antitoxin (DNA-binding transcriptional repressor) of toxin-antitoxin stability system
MDRVSRQRQEFVITKRGKRVAKLVPVEQEPVKNFWLYERLPFLTATSFHQSMLFGKPIRTNRMRGGYKGTNGKKGTTSQNFCAFCAFVAILKLCAFLWLFPHSQDRPFVSNSS